MMYLTHLTPTTETTNGNPIYTQQQQNILPNLLEEKDNEWYNETIHPHKMLKKLSHDLSHCVQKLDKGIDR